MMRSIGVKLTFYYAAAATASAALLFGSGYLLLQDRLVRGLDMLNRAEFAQLQMRLGLDYRTLTPRVIDERIRQTADAAPALFFINIDEPSSGMVFYSSNLGHRSIPDVKGQHEYNVEIPGVGEARVGEFVMHPFDVTIATPLAQVRATMRSYAVVCGGLLLTIGAGLSRVILRPLIFIRETASRIGSDNLSERIPVPATEDELSDLARLLNRMFDRLENAFNQIRRFAAEASHELKTPLSLIRLHAEKLLEGEDLSPPAIEAIVVQLEEVARLNQIIEDMLFLSRAEANAISMVLAASDPEPLLRNFAQDALVLAEHSGHRFQLTTSGTGQVQLEERWLRRVWLNLLSNALAASPPGGLVTMQSSISDGRWLVEIVDEGAGLALDELARIFDRFAQFGSPEHRAQGTGLGLAISRSIVLLHGGTINARNRVERSGLNVQICLPTCPPLTFRGSVRRNGPGGE
jgi:signal transduction histidine kinase